MPVDLLFDEARVILSHDRYGLDHASLPGTLLNYGLHAVVMGPVQHVAQLEEALVLEEDDRLDGLQGRGCDKLGFRLALQDAERDARLLLDLILKPVLPLRRRVFKAVCLPNRLQDGFSLFIRGIVLQLPGCPRGRRLWHLTGWRAELLDGWRQVALGEGVPQLAISAERA